MTGTLRKNEIGRWEIVDELGRREEITSGDVIEVLGFDGVAWTWVRTRIESRAELNPPFSAEYYSVAGCVLYSGKKARSVGRGE